MTESKSAKHVEEAIFSAMLQLLKQEDFDRITVTRIIEESGTSRTTFYRLFTDKYDFMDKFIMAMAKKFIGVLNPQENRWKELCVDFLHQASRAVSFSRCLSSSRQLTYLALRRFFTTVLTRRMQSVDATQQIKKEDLSVLSSILTAELLEWFDDSCRNNPQEVIENTMQFIPIKYQKLLRLTDEKDGTLF